MKNVVLHSFAKCLPDWQVTNEYLSSIMETSDDWISKRTGIKTRYWVRDGISTSDLGAKAAQKSIDLSEVSVGCVIASTLSPDYNFPGIGVQLQSKLGLGEVPAYDLRNQCAGFLYGIELAESLVGPGKYSSALLVGAEVHSTGLDKTTRGRDISVLFGDGAGSCLVGDLDTFVTSQGIGLKVLGTKLHSDGKYLKELWCKNPGSANYPDRITEEMISQAQIYPNMNGKKVFEHAVKKMVKVSRALLSNLGRDASEISLFCSTSGQFEN